MVYACQKICKSIVVSLRPAHLLGLLCKQFKREVRKMSRHQCIIYRSQSDRAAVVCFSSVQKLLCEKLEEQLQNLDSALKKKERAERRYTHTHTFG